MLKAYPVPAFRDNYLWLFHRDGQRQAYIVDPGDAAPVLRALDDHQLELAGILITHHHMDHTGGIRSLLARCQVPVYGPRSEAIPQVTQPLKEGDSITLAGDITLRVLEVPGHTLDHIAYVTENENPPLLFCGDTLFAGGCGRLFEGSARQMYASLTKLGELPANTLVHCAHEYTLANLKFAQAVEAGNADLHRRLAADKRKRLADEPTVPSTMAMEKATNPFLRCRHSDVKFAAEQYTGCRLSSPEEVLAAIRAWKDNF